MTSDLLVMILTLPVGILIGLFLPRPRLRATRISSTRVEGIGIGVSHPPPMVECRTIPPIEESLAALNNGRVLVSLDDGEIIAVTLRHADL